MSALSKIIKFIKPNSIKYQLIVGIALVHLVLMSFFVFDLIRKQSLFLKQQSFSDIQNLEQTFSVNASSWLLANDWEGLEEVVLSNKDFSNLKYAMVVSKDASKVLAHSDRTLIGKMLKDSISLSLKTKTSFTVLVQDDDILDIAVPIVDSKKNILGWVRIGQDQAFIKSGLDNIIRNGIFYIIIAIVVGSIFAIVIAKFLTSGLNKLILVTKKIRAGNRNVRTTKSEIVEISKLGNSINMMLDAINVSESKFRNMFQKNASVMFLVNPVTKKIIDANDSAVKFYGYSYEELCAKNMSDITTLSEKDIEMNVSNLLNHSNNIFEVQHRVHSGKIKDVEISVSVIEMLNEKLLFCIVQDVTERKKAQNKLQKTLKEVSDYKYALDQSANISLTDADGVIKYVNERFCQVSGYTAEELIGNTHKLVSSGIHSQKYWETFWNTIISGKVFRGEVCNKAKNGSLFWSDVTIVPFADEKGTIIQYLAIRYDITEKRQLEKDLSDQKQYQQKLLTETIIEAQESERDLLGRELHDNINQLLVSVKIHLAAYRAKLGVASERIEISYNCIDDAIKEVRKLSHALVIPNLDKLNFKDALENLIQIYQSTPLPKIHLVYELSEDVELENKMQLMLYRIVQEQVNNIFKHSKAKVAVVLMRYENEKLLLHITDDGVGFDTTNEMTGIGLLNIRSRVEFYSGELKLISSPDNGCKLEISIPLKISKTGSNSVDNTKPLKSFW